MRDNLVFRAVERGDLTQLKTWRNRWIDNFRQWRFLNDLNQEAWLKRVSDSDEHIMLCVCYREPPTVIGVIGLTYVDWIERCAEASIYIGEDAARGCGYGKAALAWLLDYGFRDLGLHRIYAEIFGFNEVSVRLFAGTGFRLEGTFIDAKFHDGEWHDLLVYGMLEREWERIRSEGV